MGTSINRSGISLQRANGKNYDFCFIQDWCIESKFSFIVFSAGELKRSATFHYSDYIAFSFVIFKARVLVPVSSY